MLEVLLELWSFILPLSLFLTYRAHKLKSYTISAASRIYWVAFFFSLSWETLGTEFAWAYPGFHLYLYGGIPVAVVLGWPAWLFICYSMVMLAKRKLGTRNSFMIRSALAFTSGVVVGFFVEVIGVALGWWQYLQPLPRSWSIFVGAGWIHIITFIGWGLIAITILETSGTLWDLFKKRFHKATPALIIPLSVVLGAFFFVVLGSLYLYLPWSGE